MNSLNVAGTRKGLIPRSEQLVKERGLREGGGQIWNFKQRASGFNAV